jgi:hypothetical protein
MCPGMHHALFKLCILRKIVGKLHHYSTMFNYTLSAITSYLGLIMPSMLMEQLIKSNATVHRTWVSTRFIPILAVFGGKQAIPSNMLRNIASVGSWALQAVL